MSPKEQEARWKQYLASKSDRGRLKPRSTTRVQVRRNNGGGKITNPVKSGNGHPLKPSKGHLLSDCSIGYALALSDPWDCPEAPCVPDNITMESWKFSVRARGTGVVGLNGIGFVAMNPFNPYALSVGNSQSVYVTDATYNSVGYSIGVGVVSIATDGNQPYTNAANYEQAYRVVGAGIKVLYTGNEMNRQGVWLSARDSSNSPIVGGTTSNTFLQFRETVQAPVDKKWHCCLYKPATPSDMAYAPRGLDIDGTAPGGTLYNQQPSLLVMLSGGTPGASFQFDTIVWFEMTGRGLPVLSRSHADPIGLSVASAAVSSHQPEASATQNAVSFAQAMDSHIQSFSFIDTIGDAVKRILPIVEQAAPIIMGLL